MMLFTAAEFLDYGLELVGFTKQRINNTNKTTNGERFRDAFYTDPEIVKLMFDLIQENHGDVMHHPKHMLMGLHYLKNYPTKYKLAALADETEKTALKWAHVYVQCLQSLKEIKIKWMFNDDTTETYIMSVDGVHCQMWEPRIEPSSGWCSKKHNKSGLSYELGVSIWHGQLVWINGPFPAGQNDQLIFTKPNGLLSKIPPGKKIVADEGCRGNPDVAATRNAFDIAEAKEFKERVKARHESFNSRLKAFDVLSRPFRSTGTERMEKHQEVFEACCVVVQFELENGHPLFKA